MGRLYYRFSTIQKNQSVHITLLAGVWHISTQIIVFKCIAKLHKQINCNHCTPPLNSRKKVPDANLHGIIPEWPTQSKICKNENDSLSTFISPETDFREIDKIGPGGFACATCGVSMHSWPLLLPSFSHSFSPSFAFDPPRGISRMWKFVSPNILSYLEDICKKKLGNFYFFTKKSQRSITATRSPWSILNLILNQF